MHERVYSDFVVRKHLQHMANTTENIKLAQITSPINKLTYVASQLWCGLNSLIERLGGRTIAMLSAALIIAMASILFNDNWILSITRQYNEIGQIRTNIIILNTLQTNLYSAESAQRGFLLTEKDEYIAPFNLALTDARKNIQVIDSVIMKSNDSKTLDIEKVWLAAISASLEAKAAEMSMTISLMEAGKGKEAIQIVDLDRGLQEMHKFINFSHAQIDKQNKTLDTLIAERKKTMVFARLSLLGGALVLILLVVLVIKQLLGEISVKSELQLLLVKENEKNQKKLEEQKQLLSSLALDYQADVERERQKLSRELHDELGSILTATKMDLAWVMKRLKEQSPEIVGKLKKTSSYIDQGINFKRHIVEELHPSILTTFGFWPALTLLIESAAERNQWKLTLNLPEDTTKVNETISLIAYRVVQETLNNANKYAKATTMSVTMIADEKFLKLEIEDNGIGFDVNALDGNTHGLAGMRHRVLAIGGDFEITSAPNQGAVTRALIPILDTGNFTEQRVISVEHIANH